MTAEQAAQALESLYGADLRRVKATPATADDADLARRMLAAADKAADHPEFLAALCDKVYLLAMANPAGYPAAAEAMERLGQAVPERAAACAAKLVEVRQKQFDQARGDAKPPAGDVLLNALLAAMDAGVRTDAELAALKNRALGLARAIKSPRIEEINLHAGAAAAVVKLTRQADDLKARLAKDPADAAARGQLLRLLLVDLDQPQEAARYVEGAADAAFRKYVPAAARPVEAAPELASLELADWYRTLGEGAPAEARPAMLARAGVYYERFLALHLAADADRARATTALHKAVVEALFPAEAGSPRQATAPWVDYLPRIDPKQDRVNRVWEPREGKLIAPVGGVLRVPTPPPTSYQIQVTFTRTSGDQAVSLVLPVAETACSLVLGTGVENRVSGLERLFNQNVQSGGVLGEPGVLVNGHTYVLDASVMVRDGEAAIIARVNDKPFVQWAGPVTALSAALDRGMSSKYVRVMSADGLAIQRLRIRPLTAPPRPMFRTASLPMAVRKPGGEWVELLPFTDPVQDATGQWAWRGQASALECAFGPGKLMLPVALEGSYDLRMKIGIPLATDLSRLTPVRLLLPAGSAAVMADVTLNPGKVVFVEARVIVQGDRAAVFVSVNGEPVLDWCDTVANRAAPAQWQLPNPRHPGIAGAMAGVGITGARLRVLSGEAKPVRPLPVTFKADALKATGPAPTLPPVTPAPGP